MVSFFNKIYFPGTRTKTSWLGWGREGLSWSFKFMILDFDLFQKSSAKFFRPRVLLNFQLKVNIFFLKWEYGVFESIHYIVTSLRLWSISTMKVQIQIMQTFFFTLKSSLNLYPCSAFRVVFQKMVLAWSRWASENFYVGGRKCKKLGLSSLEGVIDFDSQITMKDQCNPWSGLFIHLWPLNKRWLLSNTYRQQCNW